MNIVIASLILLGFGAAFVGILVDVDRLRRDFE